MAESCIIDLEVIRYPTQGHIAAGAVMPNMKLLILASHQCFDLPKKASSKGDRLRSLR